jgi:3-oxoacyl-(acyl-carrier-protein) synthase III
MAVGVLGLGSYVPSRRVTNDEISRWSGVTPQWVADRTGIHERRYAAKGEATSDMAAAAVRDLLIRAEVDAEQVAVLTVATATPDQPQPATAVHVQRKAGLPVCPAFDVSAVCSGFVYGLVVTAGMMAMDEAAGYGVCVGADSFSQIMDRSDPRTVALFGDGAGSVLLGPVPDGFGVVGHALLADGRSAGDVEVPAGGSALPTTRATLERGEHHFRMQGRDVKDFAAAHVPKVCDEALDRAGVAMDDVDRVIFHQGNVRLVESLAARMGVREDQMFLTAGTLGNTAAASVPLTLAQSNAERPLQRGDLVLLAAVGGGMTAGAIVVRWY